MGILLTADKVNEVFSNLKASSLNYSFDTEKHRFELTGEAIKQSAFLRLPITYGYDEVEGRLVERSIAVVIILIQSGSAAVGHFQDDVAVDHKVFKSYMVRKKQGKSQIKYLNAKGKSKAGSRVRLANTVNFFENINERLTSYFEGNEIDMIAMSCSKTLLPLLYNSKVQPPFEKKDHRIFRIPKHIPAPGHDVLMDTHAFLLKAELIAENTDEAFIRSLIP
ncbi:MAG: hypothetical protein AAFX87_27615 [Bacteroidota bacterium]